MNNLHRELAPVSSAAWADMGEEASRTFKRWIAGRRVVDVEGPFGTEFSSKTTGHTKKIDGEEGVQTRKRIVRQVVELRVPFRVSREQVDDVARGSQDSDWQPVKDAIEKLALAEDRIVFEGLESAGIEGIAPLSSNESVVLPSDVGDLPDAVSSALTRLRLAGVNGPYSLLLSAELYTQAFEGTDDGYPVLKHLERLVDSVIWAPALDGALLLTTRGGDYELHLGQDVSIGYLSHDTDTVELYVQESLTFLALTAEASVVLK